jgi:hypothetical protein
MKKIYLLLFGLIGIHIFILSKLQFTAWPEMLSFPYMIDNGFVIYKDFHHVYQPLLTYILLGVYKIFGFKLLILKVFTYILIAATDFMIFLNIKKITNKNILSISALILFILLQPIFDGNMLWFDIAVTLPVLISIYFVNNNLFLSGLFIAISFLIKQQSVLLALPIFIYLLANKTDIKDIFKFIFASTIPVFVLFLLLYNYNIFSDYLFWTFKFPLLNLPKIPGYAINPSLRELKILGIVTLTLFTGIIINFKKINSTLYLLISIVFFLILSAFPRFSLFHLQPALAVFVILIGYLLSLNKKYFIVLIIPVFILWKNVLINANIEDRFFGADEKLLAIEIKERSKGQKVYLLGTSSIEYVLSGTLPPKPWIENYVWHFEIPELQQKMIDGWKIDPPVYIYWSTPKEGNWYDLGTYQPKEVVKYIKINYQKADQQGDVEIWKLIK